MECDVFSQSLSSQVVQFRSRHLCQFDEQSNTWVKLNEINFYNFKMIRLEDQIFFIGGSSDAQGAFPTDQTLCYSIDHAVFTQKKNMSYKKTNVGACAV